MREIVVLAAVCVAASGCAPAIQQAPPPGTPVAPLPAPYAGPTIPKLLGIPDCIAAGKVCCVKLQTCCKRQFPGPGEPPNLGPVGPNSAPAVKCAAEIIAAEAEAPQKIDALRYLGRVGCTKCYPCVEESLIAALDDCTEEVRFEAAKAIRATASEQCKCCQCTSCCTQKIYDKLYKVAYDTRCEGCPVECSTRVRRVARQALCMCGGPMYSDEEEEPTPTEGPSGAAPTPAPVPPQETQAKAAPTAASPAADKPAEDAAGAPPAAEKKEAAKPAAPAGQKNAALAPDESDPPPQLAAKIVAETAFAEEPALNPLRTESSQTATGCSACGTNNSSIGRPRNPFRQSASQSISGPTLHFSRPTQLKVDSASNSAGWAQSR